MTKTQAVTMVSRILAATRGVNDMTEQIQIGSSMLREMMNEYLLIPDTEEAEIARLRDQVVTLNTELLYIEQGVERRVNRNIELIKENRRLRDDA